MLGNRNIGMLRETWAASQAGLIVKIRVLFLPQHHI